MKTWRIYLRALQSDDYKNTINWRNDDEIWSMLVGPKHFVSPDYEKKWVEEAIFDKINIRLAICLKKNNEHIGNIYLNEIDWINRSAVAGILIGDKRYWGGGYAVEAYLLLFSFAFLDRGLHRISMPILEYNTKSQSVAEKLGGIREGLLREAVYKNGKYHNIVIFSFLKDEFIEIKKQYG
ncbi:MAG: N-acetyltransferase [Desulfobacteraceae bacterium]|nr:MAG: N-acetyltransferase [Desulfobacteraceae bacterium]